MQWAVNLVIGECLEGRMLRQYAQTRNAKHTCLLGNSKLMILCHGENKDGGLALTSVLRLSKPSAACTR